MKVFISDPCYWMEDNVYYNGCLNPFYRLNRYYDPKTRTMKDSDWMVGFRWCELDVQAVIETLNDRDDEDLNDLLEEFDIPREDWDEDPEDCLKAMGVETGWVENDDGDTTSTINDVLGGLDDVPYTKLVDFFVMNTWNGDGIFSDQFGNSYGVDSGQLSMVRWDDVPEHLRDKCLRLGAVHDIPDEWDFGPEGCEDFTHDSLHFWTGLPSSSWTEGTFHFGPVNIITGPEGWEDEEEDEEA